MQIEKVSENGEGDSVRKTRIHFNKVVERSQVDRNSLISSCSRSTPLDIKTNDSIMSTESLFKILNFEPTGNKRDMEKCACFWKHLMKYTNIKPVDCTLIKDTRKMNKQKKEPQKNVEPEQISFDSPKFPWIQLHEELMRRRMGANLAKEKTQCCKFCKMTKKECQCEDLLDTENLTTLNTWKPRSFKRIKEEEDDTAYLETVKEPVSSAPTIFAEEESSSRSEIIYSKSYDKTPKRQEPRIDEAPKRHEPKSGEVPKLQKLRSNKVPKLQEVRSQDVPKLQELRNQDVPKLQEPRSDKVPKLQDLRSGKVSKLEDFSSEKVPKLQNSINGEVPKLQDISYDDVPKLQESSNSKVLKLQDLSCSKVPKLETEVPKLKDLCTDKVTDKSSCTYTWNEEKMKQVDKATETEEIYSPRREKPKNCLICQLSNCNCTLMRREKEIQHVVEETKVEQVKEAARNAVAKIFDYAKKDKVKKIADKCTKSTKLPPIKSPIKVKRIIDEDDEVVVIKQMDSFKISSDVSSTTVVSEP